MRSNNPVFTRVDGFNGNTTYAGNGHAYSGFGTPSVGVESTVGDRMTLDSVVNRTGLTLGTLVVAAGLTWFLTGDPAQIGSTAAGTLYTLTIVGALGGFVLSLVNSFKKVVSPALVLAYAALQGVFVGAVSKVFNTAYDGVVTGAVLGTVAAFVGTLAAYKFFNIKVSNKFRTWVIGAMFGFVALSLLDFGLSFFGASFGWNGLGTLGLISAVVGLGLAVLMLILDFDFVERGIAAGLPERESWRAAFGLTVTIVWIYIQLLRILAILRGDD